MIRSATPADVPAIGRLIGTLAEYEHLEHALCLDEGRLRKHLFGPQPFAEVLLAEEAGAVVGYALFFPIYSTFRCNPGLFLEDLFVQPESQGQGHGKALLAAVARRAVERGCAKVEWSVLAWNEPAIRFYNSIGAAPVGGWISYRLAGDALAALATVGPRP
jgi:GNAT superfamily N-acetyltransferase